MTSIFKLLEQSICECVEKAIKCNQRVSSHGYFIDAIVYCAIQFLKQYDSSYKKLIFHEAGELTIKYVGKQEVKLIHYLINKELNL